jgi:ABC-type uncharacterized transport system involved in gliding motility auxiliary subunit
MKWDRNEVGKFLPSIGVALLVAGYLRYSIQSTFDTMGKVLLIAGGVILIAGAAIGFQGLIAFFSKKSSRQGTNTGVLALGVIVILAIVNVLGFQHHKRFDLTTQKLFTLSDQTKNIVGGLKTDINVVRFSKTPDAQFDDLMTEYRNTNAHIKFQNIDPQEKPEIAKEYGAQHIGDIILASGSRKQTLTPTPGQPPSETDVTSDILKLTRDKVKTVCFVTGHNEKALADKAGTGYSGADDGLKKEGYATKSVNLVMENGVPADCDVLVIAGPTQSYLQPEADFVKKYIDAGGKAMIEVDPQTDPKLNDIFTEWNANLGSNVVVDASGMGRLFGTGPAVPLVVDYGDSPITKGLKGGMTFFPLARTIGIADKNKADVSDTELLKTSERTFTIPNLDRKEVKFDPKTDTQGPLTIGLSGSKRTDGKDSRVVLIGDSDFASNQWVGMQHNGDLFFNAIDWLAQDEDLISIRPKDQTDRHLTLTESQVNGLRWVDLIFVPGIVIFAGIAIWWKRR